MKKGEIEKMSLNQILSRMSKLELDIAKLRAERSVNVQDKKRYLNQRIDAAASHIGYGMVYCSICYRRIYGEAWD